MTALEARTMAASSQIGLMSIMQVLRLVEAACMKGDTSVVLPYAHSSLTSKTLTELGYGYTIHQRILTW